MRKYSERYNNMMNSTCFNDVRLEGNLLGCYNGLTSSGWVENNQGQIVWEYSHDPEIDEETGEQCFPLFSKSDFAQLGFKLVEGERAENYCKFPDNW